MHKINVNNRASGVASVRALCIGARQGYSCLPTNYPPLETPRCELRPLRIWGSKWNSIECFYSWRVKATRKPQFSKKSGTSLT